MKLEKLMRAHIRETLRKQIAQLRAQKQDYLADRLELRYQQLA